MTTENSVEQVYEYLKHAAARDDVTGAIPETSVRRYVGALDENHMFHGKGVLFSAMGFHYDGNFVHGSMEGYGFISWNSGIAYEGFFQDNAPNGKGIFTWSNGDKYVGEVKHGVRHGNGEMSTARGVYRGAWVSGKRHGLGRQTYLGNSFYEGEWLDDKRHGQGKLVYPNGDVYGGMWVNGRRHGFGAMGWKFGTKHYLEVYEGEWCDGIPQGQGRSTYVMYLDPDKVPEDVDSPENFVPPVLSFQNVYEGEYVNGTRHGFGVFYYADGGTYEGEWKNGNKEGRGKCTTSVGDSYFGNFSGNEAEELLKDAEVSGPLPSVSLRDICGISDGSPEEAKAALRILLLRFNNRLRTLFDTYSRRFENVKLITASPNWWRHRSPGHIHVHQFLRLLNDAHILNGYINISHVMNCILATIEKESEEESDVPDERWSERSLALRQDILKPEGSLNYRQFVESLVRLSVIACVGFNTSELAERFSTLMKGPLANDKLRDEPLCPLTREHETLLQPLLPSLKSLFSKIGGETMQQQSGLNGTLLPVRDFILFFRSVFESHGITLTDATNHLFPFDRYMTPGVVPTAICPPRNALGFTMYEKSCGHQEKFLADLVASEWCLTFVEFVEAFLSAIRLVGVTSESEMREKSQELLAASLSSGSEVHLDVHKT